MSLFTYVIVRCVKKRHVVGRPQEIVGAIRSEEPTSNETTEDE